MSLKKQSLQERLTKEQWNSLEWNEDFLDVHLHSAEGLPHWLYDELEEMEWRLTIDPRLPIDIGDILPAIMKAPSIRLVGQTTFLTGVGKLTAARHLKRLVVDGALRAGERLPPIEPLVDVELANSSVTEILASPNLLHAYLYYGGEPEKHVSARSIQTLKIETAQTESISITWMSALDSLEKIQIVGGGEIDISPLIRAPRLRRIDLNGCLRVKHAEVIADIKSLEQLLVSGAQHVENIGALASLQPTVRVLIDVGPIIPLQLQLLALKRPMWRIANGTHQVRRLDEGGQYGPFTTSFIDGFWEFESADFEALGRSRTADDAEQFLNNLVVIDKTIKLPLRFDSEADYVRVQFDDETQARAFASIARQLAEVL